MSSKSSAEPRSSGSGVNYNIVSDRVLQGSRFEREKEFKLKEKASGPVGSKPGVVSATFDAFRRLAAGVEGRTVADKISDSTRPTWEQYKKDNEDKLDMTGGDQKKMIQYRKELDANRDALLKKAAVGSRSAAIGDSDSEGGDENESGSGGSDSEGSSSRHHRKHHKHSKHSRHSKHHRDRSRSRDRSREKDRHRDRSRDKNSDRHRHRHRDRDSSRRDKDGDRDREREKERSHGKESRRDRSRSHDKKKD
jgi:hypothetical protein